MACFFFNATNFKTLSFLSAATLTSKANYVEAFMRGKMTARKSCLDLLLLLFSLEEKGNQQYISTLNGQLLYHK